MEFLDWDFIPDYDPEVPIDQGDQRRYKDNEPEPWNDKPLNDDYEGGF